MFNEEIDYLYMTMPSAVELIIMAYCSDYLRRTSVIESRSAPYRVLMEYRFLNHRIFTAAAEIVGQDDALSFIKEIGSSTGYAKTELNHLSERTYKRHKKAFTLRIKYFSVCPSATIFLLCIW